MKNFKKILVAAIMIFVMVFGSVVQAATTQFPPKGLGTIHTYTVWDKIKWGYGCRDLINFAKKNDALSDSYGIVTYGSYFAGALTTTFGKIGDMMLVVQEDGIVYPVIMADAKNQSNRGCTRWGHQYGKCIVEFEILSSCRKSLYNGSGGYISEVINKPIYKVINLGSVYDEEIFTKYFWNPEQACIDNGLVGYTLLKNPYGGITVSDYQVMPQDPLALFDNTINPFGLTKKDIFSLVA